MPATVKAAPARSPARQRLAEAIQRRDDAVTQHERVSEALGRIDDDIYNRLEPACRSDRETLDEAIAAAPSQLVAAALGEPADPDAGPSVAEAEAALKAADQALVDARKARSILRDEQRGLENAVESAKRAVDAAVKAVVGEDAQRAIVAEFNRAGRHFLRVSRVLRTLGIGRTAISAPDIGLTARIGDVAMPGDHNRNLYRPDPAWLSALEALREDADAQFPPPPEPDEPEPEPAEAAAA